MSELALYETVKATLAHAVSFDEVKKIRSEAAQAKAYARIAGDRQVMADWHEIVARAERQLGVHLRAAKLSGELSQGGRPSNSNLDEPETGADAEPVFERTSFTLAELGVSKKLSSRAQSLALLSDDDFSTTVTDARQKILSSDAPVLSPKRVKAAPLSAPAKPVALEARRFHQFAFSVLALSLSSDRVGSRAIQFLARECRMVAGDDDAIDFTPEAAAAMGSIAAIALKKIDGEQELPATAKQAPMAVDGDSGDAPTGAPSQTVEILPSNGGGDADRDGESSVSTNFRHSKHTAEPVLRARYEHEPADVLAAELGVPIGTVRTWAFRLGLTSKARISAMATKRNTRRDSQ